MADLCSFCEEAPATTTWGLPVCQPCEDFLRGLNDDLTAMEADDPDLAVKGRAVEEAAQRLFASGQARAKRRAEAVRELRGQRCADGSYAHDFKGHSRCPACGWAGIEPPSVTAFTTEHIDGEAQR